MRRQRIYARSVAGLLLTLVCAAAYGQSAFQKGAPLELASEGGIFTKPGYAQAGTLVAAGAVEAYLRYEFEPTMALMDEAARFDTAHVVTAAGGAALLVGGLATFIVASSGVSDLTGTISIYFTSAGLFLGSAGAWYGNWYCQKKRVELRRRALEEYDKTRNYGRD